MSNIKDSSLRTRLVTTFLDETVLKLVWNTEEEFITALNELLNDMFSFEIKIDIKHDTNNKYKIDIQFNEDEYDTILSTTIECKKKIKIKKIC